MKILSILLLVILLAMTIGCGSQGTSASKSTVPLDVTAEASNPETYEAQFAQLREELDALNTRLTNLEEMVGGVPFPNPYTRQSIGARLKALEEDVLGFNRESAFISSQMPPYQFQQSFEARLKAIEDKLGIKPSSGTYQPSVMPPVNP